MSFYTFYTFENGVTPSFQIMALQQQLYQNPVPFGLTPFSNHSQKKQKTIFISQQSIPTPDSFKQEIAQKVQKPKKTRIIKKEKDQNFGWRNQNKDRNIMSNILKAFRNSITGEINSQEYVQKTISKLGLQSDVSNFFDFVEQHLPLNKSYISPKHLKTLLRGSDLPQDMIKILKLMLSQFLRLDFSLMLMRSAKIKRRSQLEQMKKARQLYQIIFRQ